MFCYLQLMQGNIWLVPCNHGFPQSMTLLLRFQLRPSISIAISDPGEGSERTDSNSMLRNLQVLLVENDDVNRAVTQRLLQKLGCVVTPVASVFECPFPTATLFISFDRARVMDYGVWRGLGGTYLRLKYSFMTTFSNIMIGSLIIQS